MEGIVYYQSFLYAPEIIHFEIISLNYNDLLACHFAIKKTWELIVRKYFWPTFCQDIEASVKDCDVYLPLKIIYNKLYKDLQLLSMPTHYWKDLSKDFNGFFTFIDLKKQ